MPFSSPFELIMLVPDVTEFSGVVQGAAKWFAALPVEVNGLQPWQTSHNIVITLGESLVRKSSLHIGRIEDFGSIDTENA